jgi:serine/threonine-protein phosphatase PGAM5
MATNRTLYLIRHGQYHHLDYDKEAGLTVEQANKLDGGLTPVGVEQAQVSAQRLASLPITAIHSSTLPRAIQTAEIIAQALPGIPVRRSRGLHECFPCIPAAIAEDVAKVFIGDLSQGKRQAERVFDRYFKPARGRDKHEVVVCHGNLIRYLVCRVLQVPPEAWVNMGSRNCGISQILIESDGRMWLISYNDVGHLPDHLRT